jgi:transcription elongation factor GreA
VTSSQQVWLTQEAYERLKDELRQLLRHRAGALPESAVTEINIADRIASDESVVGQRERDQRIRKLQQILQDPIVGQMPPDDGIAEAGMVLTVAFTDDGAEETFLLAEREQDAYPDVEICSPGSPLGRALVGAREGEQRQYHLPSGQAVTVTLLRAVPYSGWTGVP